MFIALFLLFLVEGTWATAVSWHHDLPFLHLTLIGILYLGLYGRWEQAIGYGIVFGLLYDIVYTDLLGIYVFSFSFISLFVSFVLKYIRESFFTVVVTFTMGIFLYSVFVYGVMMSIGGSGLQLEPMLIEKIPGMVLANMIAIIVLYRPMVRFVLKEPNEKRG